MSGADWTETDAQYARLMARATAAQERAWALYDLGLTREADLELAERDRLERVIAMDRWERIR